MSNAIPNPDGLGPFPTTPAPTIAFASPNETDAPADASYTVLPDLPSPDSPVIVQRGPYWEYAVSKIWHDDAGLALNVVQGPPGTPADVVRCTAPSGYVEVRWISKRRGAAPLIPSRDSPQCPNEVYLHGWHSGAVPGHLTDGTQCWMIQGYYYYGLRVPYTERDVMVIGAMPYTNEQAQQNAITPDLWVKGVTGPSQPPEGAPTDPIDF